MRIKLISMPWAIFNRPSIQLGALKAFVETRETAWRVDCRHHYLEVARELGTDNYHWLASSGWAGEALYSPCVFPEQSASAERLYEMERRRLAGRARGESFQDAHRKIAGLLDRWLDRMEWDQLDLVGFTVCFNQLLPSLAAAKGIKARRPELPVVFGGSSCSGAGAAGLLREFQCLDYVVAGEGERPLLALARYLSGVEPQLDRAVLSRPIGDSRRPEPAQFQQLAQLPVPDYRDYFTEMSGVFREAPFVPVLPVEFSRGCWWGKCSFCNLNLQWRGYRAKSADQVTAEVAEMSAAFACLDFAFTDNVLPSAQTREFFNRSCGGLRDLRFFAELRADQRRYFREFQRGGLRSIQVGIESLSVGLLRKMRKGVRVIENLAVMKEALETGLVLEGNLILGFPGSTVDEAEETLEVLEYAWPYHPLTGAFFFLGRDSPVDENRSDYGIMATVPHPHNLDLFPAAVARRLALLVKGYRGDRLLQKKIWREVGRKIAAWQKFHAERPCPAQLVSPLSWRDGGDFLLIRQETSDGRVLNHRLRGLSRRIYLACSGIVGLTDLARGFPRIPIEKLTDFLMELTGKRLVYREGDRFLALAVRERTCSDCRDVSEGAQYDDFQELR